MSSLSPLSAFLAPTLLSCTTTRRLPLSSRSPPYAKKGGGRKRGKPQRSQPPRPAPLPTSPPLPPPSISAESYDGPLAPSSSSADFPLPSQPRSDAAFAEANPEAGPETDAPLADKGRLKLPDISSVSGKGVRRKRKPRTSDANAEPVQYPMDAAGDTAGGSGMVDRLSTDRIRELTAAYRRGGDDAETLISEIEKNPDYMFQTGNPEGEYDLTSAIIGTGRPNKQGVYLLPYLQSGHILLLLVVLLCTYVYYPGFPLTELDESIRESLQRGLGVTYAFNFVQAVRAFKDAKSRGQPAAFWALKTAFLGNLAFNELRGNAPTQT